MKSHVGGKAESVLHPDGQEPVNLYEHDPETGKPVHDKASITAMHAQAVKQGHASDAKEIASHLERNHGGGGAGEQGGY
jgi:hypothetical protein